MKVTAEAARRFLVARQLLAPARSLEGGPDAVLEVFRRLGSVQFDPLAVAGRNHDLVLHARVANYDPAWCDQLYERREIFDGRVQLGVDDGVFLPVDDAIGAEYVVGSAITRDHPSRGNVAPSEVGVAERERLHDTLGHDLPVRHLVVRFE